MSMYLASYELEEGQFCQGLASVRPVDDKTWDVFRLSFDYLLQTTRRESFDVFLRIATDGNGPQVVAGVMAPLSHADVLSEVLKALLLAIGPMAESQLVQNADAHDALLHMDLTHRYLLNNAGYRVGGQQVAAQFSLAPMVTHLLDTAHAQKVAFAYQVNISQLHDPRNLERKARKYLLGLEDTIYIPKPLLTMQRALAEGAGAANALVDEGFATSGAMADYAQTQIEDEFALALSDFGFKDMPLQSDDEAVNWFSTGLHTHLLRDLSVVDCMAAAKSQRVLDQMRKAFTADDGYQLTPPPSKAPQQPMAGASLKRFEVFISYSSMDRTKAQVICQGIESAGMCCWIAPRDIKPGEAYPEAIMRGIREVRAMVLVFSQHSNISPHVFREVERAISLKIPVIPVRLEEAELSGSMDYLISSCHWLDALDPPLGRHIQRLTKTLLQQIT